MASFVDFIAAIRGGYPSKCDFCGKEYTQERHPVPEEAGEWACTECVARWNAAEIGDHKPVKEGE